MFRYRSTPTRAAVLWICVLLGGASAGASGLILVQLDFVAYMRDEVDRLGAFERWAGKALFLWRPMDEKLALALSEIPQDSIERARKAAKVLGIGGLGLAILGPLLLRWRWRS